MARVGSRRPPEDGDAEAEPLSQSVTHVIEEARMLIPGVTAFLGFQTIAVFNQGFLRLAHNEQVAHLVAMFLTLASLVLLLTPAAYHRQMESGWASEGFVTLSSRLITAATPAFALCLRTAGRVATARAGWSTANVRIRPISVASARRCWRATTRG